MGRNGRKNCRVIGKRRDVKSSDANAVLVNGLASMIDSEKMPMIIKRRYWKS